MKTLYLLRHAKSSWKDVSLADIDRPLKKRGKNAADFIGRFLLDNKEFPDLILCSPAKRAKETIDIVKKSAKLLSGLRYDKRIYGANPHTLMKVVSEIDNNVNSVLLVGHNPAMEEFLESLTGQALRMPTAALAKINLRVGSWRELSMNEGELLFFVTPRAGLVFERS